MKKKAQISIVEAELWALVFVELLCESWNQFQDTVFTWAQELESMAA